MTRLHFSDLLTIRKSEANKIQDVEDTQGSCTHSCFGRWEENGETGSKCNAKHYGRCGVMLMRVDEVSGGPVVVPFSWWMRYSIGELIHCGVHCTQCVSGDFSFSTSFCCNSLVHKFAAQKLYSKHGCHAPMFLYYIKKIKNKIKQAETLTDSHREQQKSLRSETEKLAVLMLQSAEIRKFPSLFPITILTKTVKDLINRCPKITNVHRNPP